MKVSNSRITKISAYCHLFLAIVFIAAIPFVNVPTVNIALFTISCIIIILFFRLKSITYELSGECITIRKSHPLSFKKYITPNIEFPQNYISDYHYANSITSRVLTIKIKSKRDKKFEIRITLFGFSSAQKEMIQNSLGSVLSRNTERSIKNFQTQSAS